MGVIKLMKLIESAKPCVGSGHCCQVATCWEGLAELARRNEPSRHKTCPFLRAVLEPYEHHRCGLMLDATARGDTEEVKRLHASLYVGAGCCSPLFNTKRETILRLRSTVGR